jgi:hypothetical protein
MSQDKDKLILGWLNRQPAGSALANAFPNASQEELLSLERRGLIMRIPSRDPNGMHGYVIAPEGRDLQTGD